jgi:dipeptidyl aminopeptidase/acylaminoacyl peptidase
VPAAPDPSSVPIRLIASTRTDEAPQYSPDGKRIAFASTRTGPSEIWVCGREGADCAPQTRAGVHSGTPRWSPDGRYIAYDSRPDGQSDVFVLELATGQVSRVTSSPAEDVVPSFSRDSRFVYFASIRSGAWQVYRARLDGSDLRQVTTGGGFAAFEGEDAVYFTRQEAPGLWRVPVTGGLRSKVSDLPSCWGHWALGRTGAFLLEAQPGLDTAIDTLDLRSGQRSRLRTLSQAAPCAESSLAVSPDDRELLYVAVEDESDIMGVAAPD